MLAQRWRRRGWWWDALVLAGYALALLVLFWPVVFGGKVLVPFDNLFSDPPWSAFAAQWGVETPQNGLLSDLVLENYAWKRFIREAIRAREIPLWNPYIFAGVPFLAAGQHSALYPLSVLFYLLPLAYAYGLFTVVQLWLAGCFAYAFGRVIGLSRLGAALTGLAYSLSTLMIANVVFPMIIAAMSWLPALLAVVEWMVRGEEQRSRGAGGQGSKGAGEQGSGHLLAFIVGAIIVGLQFLAGHVEMSYYVVLVAAFYGAWRLVGLWRRTGEWRRPARLLGWLVAMGLVGGALAGVQLVPLYELVSLNFRQGSVSYQQVISWAYPLRQVVTFLAPDFFGNPAHHRVLDLTAWRWAEVPGGSTAWGIKNYVEAASYLGVLPLLLAPLALWRGRRPYALLFAVLAGVSLLFAFGTPAYALLYYGLPGFSQLHTPFRWVFPYTFSLAVLAGLGLDALLRTRRDPWPGPALVGGGALLAGLLGLGGLAASYVFRQPALDLAARLLSTSQAAQGAFGAPGLFYSYQARNLGLFALLLTAGGLLLLLARRASRRTIGLAALGLVAADLLLFGWGFNPAVDPRLGQFTPPAVEFLRRDQGLYRVTSYGPGKILWPNLAMTYDVADVRGYDSIIPRQYVEFMNRLEDQTGMLLYNRIAPLRDAGSLDSPLLDLLNVKYVLSLEPIQRPGYRQVYDGEVQVYENVDVLPRAFVVPRARVVPDRQALLDALPGLDPRVEVLIEEEPPVEALGLAINRQAEKTKSAQAGYARAICHLLPAQPDDYEVENSQVTARCFSAGDRTGMNCPCYVATPDQSGLCRLPQVQSSIDGALLYSPTNSSSGSRHGPARLRSGNAPRLISQISLSPGESAQANLVANFKDLPDSSPTIRLIPLDLLSCLHRHESSSNRGTFQRVSPYQTGNSLLAGQDWAAIPRPAMALDSGNEYPTNKRIGPAASRSFVYLPVGQTGSFPNSLTGAADQAVKITSYRLTEVRLTVRLEQPAWLVLTDSYFPGWRAYVSADGDDEVETRIYRADGNFRAVWLPAGEHRVRFRYSPMSFKLGLYVSFLGVVVLGVVAGYWLWGRLYREEGEVETVRRVAKNSLAPMITSLVNKVVDFAFAAFMLRVLGPSLAGRYYFAIVVVGFLEILTNFGLNLLMTREVAKDRSQGNRYLSNTAILRLILWCVALPLLLAYLLARHLLSPLTPDTVWAILLLTLALVPANVSMALSSLFYACEKMEYPAGITTITTLLKVALGTLALLVGWGFVGLAGVAIVVNVITAAILFRLTASLFFRPRLEFDPGFNRQMLHVSYPLMLNHLLQTLFFKVDVILLEQLRGDIVVGWYSTAYKWIDALLIIPAYFTMAIFPIMSRYAASAKESLMRAYVVALRVLVLIALPVAVVTTFIARELITILGGSQYLPHGAIALQIMIWFLPFSFINGVTQYVLIAVDQQRWITKSFLIAAAFNILANLALIPPFGYPAAAFITILSELVLFVPFYWGVRQHVGGVPWSEVLPKPALAALAMGATLWAARPISFLVSLPLAGMVYLAGLLLLGAITEEDRQVLRRLLPGGVPAPGPAQEV